MASEDPAVPMHIHLNENLRKASQNSASDCTETGMASNQNKQQLSGVVREGVNVCQFFLLGKCRFGDECRQSHSYPSAKDPKAPQMEQDEYPDGDKDGKHKRRKMKGQKTKKPRCLETNELAKKPRMRTADEVISRILWDESVDAAEFVVGYLDRFLGVMERPFCEFNWDADPCDCDYSVELALPRHRIQYFTYKGRRVWDRNTRSDRVFGSTGQPLAPPFGMEEVDEGKTQNIQDENQSDSMDGQQNDHSGQVEEAIEEPLVENAHLEVESQYQTRNPTLESSQTHLAEMTGTGISYQGQQQEEKETKIVKKEVSPPRKVETGRLDLNSEEWNESWNSRDAEQNTIVAQMPFAALEQRGRRSGGARPPKRRPTHFIAFRANTPSILSCSQRLQVELLSLLPASSPYWLDPATLHVTMCLLVLPGQAEVEAAGDILRRFAHLDHSPPVAVTFPLKLKHFNGRVLYLSPQPQIHLQQLNSGLQEAYREQGLLHRDSYSPSYHLTLAKQPPGSNCERLFEGVEEIRAGKGLNFGRLPVNTLYLCPMGAPKREDGFYETVCSVNLR